MTDIVDMYKDNKKIYPKTHKKAIDGLNIVNSSDNGLMAPQDKNKLDRLNPPLGGIGAEIPFHMNVPLYSLFFLNDQKILIVCLEDGWYTIEGHIFVDKGSV